MMIKTHIEPPVARVQLNSQDTLNALNLSMGKHLQSILDDLDNNPLVKVIILESLVPKAFSVGIDLKEFFHHDSPEYRIEFLNLWNSVANFSKPIVVSLHGYTLGGGLELALMGDILIAADDTVLGQPELSVGTIPGLGATQRLSYRIGRYRANDLIFTGRKIDAYTALNWGMISQVTLRNDLSVVTLQVAHRISEMSLPLLIKAKAALRESERSFLDQGIKKERSLFLSTFDLDDQKEGFKAFLDKRNPNFKDR